MSAPGLHPTRLTERRAGRPFVCVYRTGRGAVVFHGFADAAQDDGLQHTLTVAQRDRSLLMARLARAAHARDPDADARLRRGGALICRVAWVARSARLDTLDRIADWLTAQGVPFVRDTFGGE